MAKLYRFDYMKDVPAYMQRQLKGMGNCTTHDNIRTIAFGLGEDDGREATSIAIIADKKRVLSWGLLYWDDVGIGRDPQGIQLYTRISERQKGYGKRIYKHLHMLMHDHRCKPIISVFKDNIPFWKKVGAVPMHVHTSMQRTRPNCKA